MLIPRSPNPQLPVSVQTRVPLILTSSNSLPSSLIQLKPDWHRYYPSGISIYHMACRLHTWPDQWMFLGRGVPGCSRFINHEQIICLTPHNPLQSVRCAGRAVSPVPVRPRRGQAASTAKGPAFRFGPIVESQSVIYPYPACAGAEC